MKPRQLAQPLKWTERLQQPLRVASLRGVAWKAQDQPHPDARHRSDDRRADGGGTPGSKGHGPLRRDHGIRNRSGGDDPPECVVFVAFNGFMNIKNLRKFDKSGAWCYNLCNGFVMKRFFAALSPQKAAL